MELQGKKINFLGDSITEGVGTSGPEAVYPALIQKKYGLAAARNYGISGTRFARQEALGPDDVWSLNDFSKRCCEMDPDADAVVVFGGTNDFGHGSAPLGTPDDRTPDTFYGACHYISQKLIEQFPTAQIVFLTPLHRLSEDNPCGDCKPVPVAALSVYVDIIKEVARFYAIPVLDLFAVSGIQPRVPVIQERYVPDGLHPNDAGQRILADKIAHFPMTL